MNGRKVQILKQKKNAIMKHEQAYCTEVHMHTAISHDPLNRWRRRTAYVLQQEKSQSKDIFRKVVYLKPSLFNFVQIYSIINVLVLPRYCTHQNICLITSEKISNDRNTVAG